MDVMCTKCLDEDDEDSKLGKRSESRSGIAHSDQEEEELEEELLREEETNQMNEEDILSSNILEQVRNHSSKENGHPGGPFTITRPVPLKEKDINQDQVSSESELVIESKQVLSNLCLQADTKPSLE